MSSSITQRWNGNGKKNLVISNEYYGELCSQIYEKGKSIAEGKELAFFLSFVQDKKMKVLEPMCGNGRMLIPFMEKGIDIEGFDISEEMLRVCRSKAKQLKLEPNVAYGKIETFKSEKNYDLIMIPFGSFSLLPNKLVKDSLHNMRAILINGGKLLLTVISKPDTVENILDWQETNRYDFEHYEIIEYKKVRYDQASKMLHTKLKYELVTDGQIKKTEIMDFPIRLYESGEMEEILKTNGFDNAIQHEVRDGYGKGNSFHVYECIKEI